MKHPCDASKVQPKMSINFDPAGQPVDSHVILVAISSLLPTDLDAYTQRQTVATGHFPTRGPFAR